MTIAIDPGFRGPDDSGDDGHVCGRMAAHLNSSAAVTLDTAVDAAGRAGGP